MKISNRLKIIADMIPENSKVIDVGCDHGLLSIYLEKEKHCLCIGTDINKNALESAKINKKKYQSDIQLFLTDGLSDIDIKNNDYIVIAGMGTTTIKHILDSNNLSNNLVIASNNQIYELRKYVVSLGYFIDEEKFVEDHQKKYVIIKFIKGEAKYSLIDLEYGPKLKNNLEYLIYELERLLIIKERINDSSFVIKLKNKNKISKLKNLIEKTKGK